MTTHALAQRIAAQPYTAAAGHYSLALTTSNAEATVVAGVSRVTNNSTVVAIVRIGSAVTNGTPGNTVQTGQFALAPGEAREVVHGTSIHALVLSGTGRLDINSFGAL